MSEAKAYADLQANIKHGAQRLLCLKHGAALHSAFTNLRLFMARGWCDKLQSKLREPNFAKGSEDIEHCSHDLDLRATSLVTCPSFAIVGFLLSIILFNHEI